MRQARSNGQKVEVTKKRCYATKGSDKRGKKKTSEDEPEEFVARADGVEMSEGYAPEGHPLTRQTDPLRGKIREPLPDEALERAMLW